MTFRRKGRRVEIHISVDKAGQFSYRPSTAVIKKHDKVTWTSDAGSFAVHFEARSPFRKVRISSRASKARGANGGQRIERAEVGGRPPGTYKYAVAVFDRATDRVLIDACPELILEC